ncbi:MAG: hypothetical protein EOO01_41570, partial [Chitinophagaceae bacterium]
MKLKDAVYKATHWESWHYHIKYIPLLPAWFWYCIRSRSFWFFTSANPTLTFGGMEGETKEEMYTQLPPGTFPNSIFVSPGEPFENILKNLSAAGIGFPCAVKPNVGMMGYLFRKVSTVEDLKKYHHKIPVKYVVQQLVDYPMEVSVFYYRIPGKEKGTISGFLSKESPQVYGDGSSTLAQLIGAHNGVRFRREEMMRKHEQHLGTVIPKGERYALSDASNRSQGGKLVGLEHEIDDALLALFDEISHYNGKFFYGRYDVKCTSVADLKARRNFSILEYNGSGSGTQHVYGNGYTLFQASKIILQHWRMLFAISRENFKKGEKPWGFMRGLKFFVNAKKNLGVLEKLDK